MAGWKAGHQTTICLPSNSLDMSTSISVDTLTVRQMHSFPVHDIERLQKTGYSHLLIFIHNLIPILRASL